jgi:ribosomal protein L36
VMHIWQLSRVVRQSIKFFYTNINDTSSYNESNGSSELTIFAATLICEHTKRRSMHGGSKGQSRGEHNHEVGHYMLALHRLFPRYQSNLSGTQISASLLDVKKLVLDYSGRRHGLRLYLICKLDVNHKLVFTSYQKYMFGSYLHACII